MAGNSPVRDKVYLVTGTTGSGRNEGKFLCYAFLYPDAEKDAWRDLNGDHVTDQGWVVHHYTSDVIMLPDKPETPDERLKRLEKENTDLRRHINFMSIQDQGAGGNVTEAELGRLLLRMAKEGTCL